MDVVAPARIDSSGGKISRSPSSSVHLTDLTSNSSFLGQSHSVENLTLPQVINVNHESGDLSITSLDIKTASLESPESSGTRHSIIRSNTVKSEDSRTPVENDDAPGILTNIELIEEIHRRTQSTLIQCLQKENAFLKARTDEAKQTYDEEQRLTKRNVPDSANSIPAATPPASSVLEQDKLPQARLTPNATITTLQDEIKRLSASVNMYKQKSIHLEEQRRYMAMSLGQESGKLKMLEQVVLDKDAEIHRLLAENLEASRIISLITKSNRQSPAVSLSATSTSTSAIAELNRQLEAVTRYSTKTEERLREAEVELKLCRKNSDEKSHKINELADLLQKKTEEAKSLTDMLQSAQSSLQQHEETVTNYKRLLKERSAAIDRANLLLKEKDDELEKVMALTSEIQRDTGNLSASLSIKDLRITELETRLSKKSKEAKKLGTLRLLLDSKQNQLIEANENIDALHAQITAKNDLINTLNEELELRSTDLKDLEQQMQTMKSSTAAYGLAAVSAEKMLLEFKQQKEKLIIDLEQRTAELRQQRSENNVLKTQISELSQLEEQRLQHTSQLMASFKAKDEEITRMLGILSEWERKYGDAISLISERDNEIMQLKQSLREKDSEFINYVAETKEMQCENTRLRIDIETLEKTRQNFLSYKLLCNTLIEQVTSLSELFLISETVESFLSSPQFQGLERDSDEGSSSEVEVIRILEENIKSFCQKIVTFYSSQLSDIKNNPPVLIDTSINTDCEPNPQVFPELLDNEVQTAPLAFKDHITEIERLSTTISQQERELISLRNIIISKNEQIRRLLQGDEFG